MIYIAHIRETDGEIQTVDTHLNEVRDLCEHFGEKIGARYLAGLAGMLHDAGKYAQTFQDYIIQAVKNPDNPPRRGEVDHSTAGGKMLFDLFHQKGNMWQKLLVEIVANAIISHHANLQDYLSPDLESPFLKRVRDKELPHYEVVKGLFYNNIMMENDLEEYAGKAVAELQVLLAKHPEAQPETKLHFITKYIFGCLIDADRTNTRQFEENERQKPALDRVRLFQSYYEKLMKKITSFDPATTAINQLRSQMSIESELHAEKKTGVYTLSIPTGGGKTLASFRYALKHAIHHQKERIIYVVPFTTIIEQNADEIRGIIQDDEHLLEHHSNIILDNEVDDEYADGLMTKSQKLKLAKDNWDSPIIFTTMVQFLNTFYAKGNRNTRRLHNLSRSVIIFDEVQKVPVKCISLFNQALNFLHTTMDTTAVLCTATQPALNYVENQLLLSNQPEMISEIEDVITAFKRTDIVDLATDQTVDTEKLRDVILEKMMDVRNMLVILNTKTVVKRLYNELKESNMDAVIYHLSTSMCAAHRKEILQDIREKLIAGEPIICVSTQLIEAGVDVSFECVIRSLAGLDSIAQAAGRCNRHGETERKSVFVIDHSEENLDKLKEIQIGKRIARMMLIDLKRDPSVYGGDLLSGKAMEKYFAEYYGELKSDLDYFVPSLLKNMTDLLSAPKDSYDSYAASYESKNKQTLPLCLGTSYKSAADYFNVIENATTTALVPYGEGENLISSLLSDQSLQELSNDLRKVQQYTVELYLYEVQKLVVNNGIRLHEHLDLYILTDGSYNDQYGVDVESDSISGFMGA